MRLVLHPPVDDARLEKIKAEAGPMEVVNCANEVEAQAAIQYADAFFGKLTPELLARAKRLKWVQTPTASLEHYIFPELVENPCILTNMRGLFSDVIADHVLGYILCFARNLHLYLRRQIESHWEPLGGESQRSTITGGPGHVSAIDRAHLHLSDCVLGVVGLGAIGREIARRGSAFGMRVVAVDPVTEKPPAEVESLWCPDELDHLLAVSDFVAIAAPHTPDTERMFALPQFHKMKQTAYLINIGRGAIVALDDLVAALEAKEIAGAGLDVFEVEPLPADHPLWRMENVIITPHVAAASVHIAERHLEVLLDNVGRFVAGEPLRNVANKEKWF